MRRREFLIGATAGLGMLKARRLPAAATRWSTDPFTLGVASGFPTTDGVVLWTRLAPEPLAPGGGVPADVVPVDWEIAADPRFRRVHQAGRTFATADFAHAVHVEPTGLEPGREYWYRFRAGDAASPVGRTLTAPARDGGPARLTLALASCQQFEHGYYAAYRHMVEDAPDLVVHVGDYIYERTWGELRVRNHGAPECHTLDDYRARHALYKSDPDLRAAHAAAPWILTWDDHEVDNDYADDVSEGDDDPRLFAARRAAAYRAYYEHLPLPRRAVPFGPHMPLASVQSFGDLLTLFALDGRQYRTPHACPAPGRRGGRSVDAAACPDLGDPARSMLGARQEAWLAAGLERSRTRWNLLAQQTVMTRIDEQPGEGERFWTDNWNGYPAARARLLEAIAASGAANPVVLSGDVHAFAAAQVFAGPDLATASFTVPELVTTSISSQAIPQAEIDRRIADNPHVLLADGRARGYARLTLGREHLDAAFVAIDDPARADSGARVLARLRIDAGDARLARDA